MALVPGVAVVIADRSFLCRTGSGQGLFVEAAALFTAAHRHRHDMGAHTPVAGAGAPVIPGVPELAAGLFGRALAADRAGGQQPPATDSMNHPRQTPRVVILCSQDLE